MATGAAATLPPPYVFYQGPTAPRDPFGHAHMPAQTPASSGPGVEMHDLSQTRLTPTPDGEAGQAQETSFRQQVKLELDMLSASMASTTESLAKLQQESIATRDVLQQLLNQATGKPLETTPPPRASTDPWHHRRQTDPWSGNHNHDNNHDHNHNHKHNHNHHDRNHNHHIHNNHRPRPQPRQPSQQPREQ